MNDSSVSGKRQFALKRFLAPNLKNGEISEKKARGRKRGEENVFESMKWITFTVPSDDPLMIWEYVVANAHTGPV